MNKDLIEMILLFILIVLMLSGCGTTGAIEFFPDGEHLIC